VLQRFHDTPLGGHQGFQTTWTILKPLFYATNFKHFVKRFIKTCDQCQRIKSKPSTKMPLKPIQIGQRPWEIMFFDFIGPLPIDTSTGKNMIALASDQLTKMIHIIPCSSNVNAKETAHIYLQHIWKLHGFPKEIITDRGTQFTSKFMQEVLAILGIKARLSSGHHPQTAGQSERNNRFIEDYLRNYVNYHQNNWVQFLPIAEFVFNNHKSVPTQQTPFFLNYGYNPSFSLNLQHSNTPAVNDYMQDLFQARQKAQESIKKYQDAMIKHNTSRPQEFSVGQKVYITGDDVITTRPTRKLEHKRFGPFEILEKIGTHNYRLKLTPQYQKIHPIFHADKLTLHHEDGNPHRIQPPPPPIVIGNEEEFEVDQILDIRRRGSSYQYKIRWKNYGPEDDTWEPIANLSNATGAILDFHRENPHKDIPGPYQMGDFLAENHPSYLHHQIDQLWDAYQHRHKVKSNRSRIKKVVRSAGFAS